MQDADKTKKQLLAELIALRQRNAELEAAAQEPSRSEEALRESAAHCRLLEENVTEVALRTRDDHQGRLASEQATLAEIGRIISASPDIDDVYEPLAVAVRKLLPCDRLTISLFDPDASVITNSYAAGTDIPTRRTRDTIPLAGTMTEATLHIKQGLFFHPQHEMEVSQQFPGLLPLYRGGLRSFLAVPLISQDRTIGVLQIQTHLPTCYTDHFLQLAASVSTQVAGAIAIAELYRERQRAEQALRESEERFKGLFENSPAAICLKDRNGYFLLANKRFEEWYSLAGEEVVGKTSHDIFPLEYADCYVAQDQEVLERQTVIERELTVPFADGSVHLILVTKYPVCDTNGRPVGVGTITTDITESKQAEEALRASEELNRRIVEAVLCGIAQVSQEGKIVRVNAEAQRFFGLEHNDLIEHFVSEFAQHTIWEDGRLCEVQDYPVSKCLATQQPQTAATIGVRRPDGAVAWAVFTAIPLADPATGEATGAVVTFLDITERKRAEEALLQAERLASIGTLAAGMAHELNNPLGAITVTAEHARKALTGLAIPEGIRECLDDILDDANRCAQTVKQALACAREGYPVKTVVDLHPIIETACTITRSYAKQHGVPLALALAPASVRIRANVEEMELALVNLIRNAVEAGQNGAQVSLRTEVKDAEVQITVQDTGAGLTEEEQHYAFDPFYTTRQNVGGTGLGLSITRRIIANHEGTIELRSRPGQGTLVRINLPLVT